MNDSPVSSPPIPQPTRWQWLVASNWLLLLLQLACMVFAVRYVVTMTEPTLAALHSPWFLMLELVSLVLALCVGWLGSFPLAWVTLGPIMREQGKRNGGPFTHGDWVRILVGPYEGTIALVYSTWQNETVRVDLGAEAKAEFRDIFPAYQLMRACNGGEAKAEADANR